METTYKNMRFVKHLTSKIYYCVKYEIYCNNNIMLT